MSNWKLKTPGSHPGPPKATVITIIPATKPAPASRNKPKPTS
jgi:hypothetical protein